MEVLGHFSMSASAVDAAASISGLMSAGVFWAAMKALEAVLRRL